MSVEAASLRAVSEALQIDISGATAVASAVTRFDWSWTATDLDRATRLLSWSKAVPNADGWAWTVATVGVGSPMLPTVGAQKGEAWIRMAENGTFDSVLIHVADVVDNSNDVQRASVRAVFEQLSTHFHDIWGEPVRGEDQVIDPTWVFPNVVFRLSYRTKSVSFVLSSPNEYQRRAAAAQAHAERQAQRTNYSPFVDTIARLVQAEFGMWSRAEVDRLVASVGWPVEDRKGGRSRDVVAAGIDDDDLAISLTADETEDYLDADRWGYGEFRRVTLSQSLSGAVGSAAYAAALHTCAELLGPPSLVGGPDARAIWRGTQVTITLTRSGFTWLYLEVTPTEPEEGYAHWQWTNSDDWRPEDCWLVNPNARGTRYSQPVWGHPERPAGTWAELDDYIDALVSSLVSDLPLLHSYATEIVWSLSIWAQRSVQCWFLGHRCPRRDMAPR